jgi:hypothetical protein
MIFLSITHSLWLFPLADCKISMVKSENDPFEKLTQSFSFSESDKYESNSRIRELSAVQLQ